jgi:predicted DNA-binding transcriptional regulator AlpA
MIDPEAPVPALPRYLTARQLAEVLQCCQQTVRNWCNRGLLPQPLMLGRRKLLWDADAVRDALARLRRT